MEVSEGAVQAFLEACRPWNSDNLIDEVSKGLTAAAPHLAAVRVKKLEWTNSDEQRNDEWLCSTETLPPYTIMRWWLDDARDEVGHFEIEGLGEDQFGTLDEAKAAAQADYEARILSALEPSAARELALEEHLQAIEQQLAINLGYFHDEKRFLLETLQAHITTRIAAIRALSSPDHADASKVEGGGCPGVKGVIPTKFGESICFSGIDDARLILVSVCGNSGLVPVKYLLPHQLYMHDVQKLSEQGEVLVCAVPVYDQQIHVTSALPSAPASEGAE